MIISSSLAPPWLLAYEAMTPQPLLPYAAASDSHRRRCLAGLPPTAANDAPPTFSDVHGPAGKISNAKHIKS